MNSEYSSAFFTLHRNLPREGPGEPADVAWAADVAGLGVDARICDAACGPGADIPALLAAAPQGHVTALEKHASFVHQAQARHSADPRTTIREGDIAAIQGPFDFIWSAGAVYFLGVETALTLWRAALAPRGTVAFSQICWFTDTPSDAARTGWAGYPEMTDETGLAAQISAAGYECLGSRRLSDAAWEAYYEPLDQRIADLSSGASDSMQEVLDEAREEAALWRAERATFGYVLSVVRPA